MTMTLCTRTSCDGHSHGALIKACIARRDVSVDRLETYLDEGYFEEYGVPRATYADGFSGWHYSLMYGANKLEAGQHFSDYNIPSGATIHVLKETISDLKETISSDEGC